MGKVTTKPQEQIVSAEPEIFKIIQKRVTTTEAGLTIDAKTTFEEWEQLYGFYTLLRERSKWLLGDVIRFGERFGHKYEQAIHITGKSKSYLTTIVSVCSRFDLKRRRPALSFQMHVECAYIPPQEADALLVKAERENWQTDDMRAEVAKVTERMGIPKRQGRGKASSLPSTAKTEPPTLDGAITVEKVKPPPPPPLVWNGYPLATKNGLLYYGPEPIHLPEADACAHYFKFQSSERLVAWLNEHGFTEVPERKPATAKQAQPEAPAPRQQASEPPPATTTPPKAPQSPTDAAEEAARAFIEATTSVDWQAMGTLEAKKWLKLLVPIDQLIDVLATKARAKRT